jgi:putative transposase
MPPVISAVLAFVVTLFRSRSSLCLEHLALRHQLALYQQTVHRPRLHATDRLFWAWLSQPWSAWRDAVAFVQPRTVIAWRQQRFRDHWRQLSRPGTPGRPAVAREVRVLIQDMWQANPTWGSPRIAGELRKVGIDVTKSTVEKYRIRPPKPPSQTWKAFLANHVQDLVALDFFVVPTVRHTVLFVLVILAMNGAVSSISTSRNIRQHNGQRSRSWTRSRGTKRHAISCTTGTGSMASRSGSGCST